MNPSKLLTAVTGIRFNLWAGWVGGAAWMGWAGWAFCFPDRNPVLGPVLDPVLDPCKRIRFWYIYI